MLDYRFYATVKEVDSTEDIVGWATKPVMDRDGEIVLPEAWDKGGLDNYRKNPVLLLSHDWSRPPVGKVLWIKATDQGLAFKARFADTPIGQELKSLYREGIMNAFSIGFRGERDEANPNQFKSAELYEISCVSVPSCPDALTVYAKSGKIQSDELKEFMATVTKDVEKELEKEVSTDPPESSEAKAITDAEKTDANIQDAEVKVGRAISRANAEKIREAINNLMGLVQVLEAGCSSDEDEDEDEDKGTGQYCDEEDKPKKGFIETLKKEEKTFDLSKIEIPSKKIDFTKLERKESDISELKKIEEAKKHGKCFI